MTTTQNTRSSSSALENNQTGKLNAGVDKKRPSTDFMAKVQKDINPSMRAILIDWLVEVAEEYRKYEEIGAPQVEEFCYITDNTYFKEEVLQIESAVLNYLKFEMTAPTVKWRSVAFQFVTAAGTVG
uniref:Cyclin A1 n=1 Tax=Solanum tuberosum TaxID=4113 RepID=M1AJ60_SOLTU